MRLVFRLSMVLLFVGAGRSSFSQQDVAGPVVTPAAATAAVADDADDPAVWINPRNPAQSLILGTNKVAAPGGGLYVFGLDGAVRQVVQPLDRPNNVDVEYGLSTDAGAIDIAVVTERLQHRLRVLSITEAGVTPVDGGGIAVLAGETGEAAMPMGISLYKRAHDGAIFAIVAPKTGGTTNYLWQYRLTVDAATRTVLGTIVRRFGNYSGVGEIEAVAVDDELGYVYYADEEFALRKWHADPDHADAATELAVFGREGFTLQREGLAIVTRPGGTGFIVASDQIPGGTQLHLFRREGEPGRPHAHAAASPAIRTAADSTDGLEAVSTAIDSRFPDGFIVMMNSEGRNFQLYDWRAVERAKIALQDRPAVSNRKRLIAHRGASAYAPEHTIAAYRLALEQGADYVEQDLAVTKDGVLVCLHDDTLERTTDVEQVFPDRAVVDPATGQRHWWIVDFTLAEVKQLDAGSWFDPKFSGARVPTWEEAVAVVGSRAGLYPELKSPPLYRARGIDMTGLFAGSLRKLGLAGAPASRMIVQSFDPQALKDLVAVMPGMARTFLIDSRDARRWFSPEGMREIAAFATDIGPSKLILDRRPELVALAHDAGLTVTPYTFTTRAAGRIADVTAEMTYYLRELGVDALFTDNPDRFPR